MSLFDDLAASPIGQYYKSNWNLWTGGSGEELSSRERPVDVDHGPYAGQQTWRDADGDPVGWSGKFGLGNYKDKQGDDVISLAQGTGNLDVGAFRDADGVPTTGIAGGLTSEKVNLETTFGEHGMFAMDFGGPDAGFNGSHNKNVTQSGISANLASASMTVGTKGTDRDESLRLGVSAGEGASWRLHHGDKDGDGRNEYGFGMDVGPASFDFKTEDPVHAALMASPAGAVLAPYELLTGGPKTNYTDVAGQWVDETNRDIDDALDSAGDYATETYDDASQEASRTYEEASDYADEAYEEVAAEASGVANDVEDGARAVWGWMTED